MEKKLVKFFKKSEQSVIKCNDIATNDTNNAVISQQVEKIEKDFMIFFFKFREISDEVNEIRAIRNQLRLLIRR